MSFPNKLAILSLVVGLPSIACRTSVEEPAPTAIPSSIPARPLPLPPATSASVPFGDGPRITIVPEHGTSNYRSGLAIVADNGGSAVSDELLDQIARNVSLVGLATGASVPVSTVVRRPDAFDKRYRIEVVAPSLPAGWTSLSAPLPTRFHAVGNVEVASGRVRSVFRTDSFPIVRHVEACSSGEPKPTTTGLVHLSEPAPLAAAAESVSLPASCKMQFTAAFRPVGKAASPLAGSSLAFECAIELARFGGQVTASAGVLKASQLLLQPTEGVLQPDGCKVWRAPL